MYVNSTSLFATAQAYAQRGFHVLPVHSVKNGICSCGKAACGDVAKHPKCRHGVKDATTDAEKLKSFFDNVTNTNIGVATGEPSGVVVLDVDDVADLERLEHEHGQLPRTPIVETGSGGRHYYFRFDERCRSLKNSTKFAGALDVRATGTYVLLPPSMHKSGSRYRWLTSLDECSFAHLPDWLLAMMPKHGETLTVQRAKTLKERAKAYASKCRIAVKGNGGAKDSYYVLNKVVELFGALSDDDLLDALDEWNSTCLPPRTEEKLRHKIDDARKQVGVKPKHVQAVGNGVPADVWPTMHADALHGLAGDVVRRLEPHTECDSAALLLTLLTTFGVAVGRRPYFTVEGSRHHVNEFACVVGSSAKARKGTSWGRIADVFRDSIPSRLSGLSSGEGLIASVKDADVSESGGKFSASDGVNDKRRIVHEAELARTLKAMKRETNTLSAILRDAWDTGDLSVITRGNPLTATDAHIGIVAHITLDELKTTLGNGDVLNGFSNRFLWGLAKRSKLLPDGGGDVRLDDLRERLKVIIERSSYIDRMERDDDTKELWRSVYSELVEERSGTLYDAATSRAEAHVLRLSMIYALLDGQPTIAPPHLKAALAVWRYCDASARLLFAETSKDGDRRTKIVELITASPGINRSELGNAISHSLTSSELDALLFPLEQQGVIVCIPVYDKRQADAFYQAPDAGEQGTEPTSPTLSSPFPVVTATNGTTEAATLAELFDYRNAEQLSFVRLSDGSIGLSSDDVPARFKATCRANQSTLALFVPPDDTGSGTHEPAPRPTSDDPNTVTISTPADDDLQRFIELIDATFPNDDDENDAFQRTERRRFFV